MNRMRRCGGTAVLGAAFFMAGMADAAPAIGQPQCDERAHVLALLARQYREAPVAAGVTNGGGLVEVLSDGKGGTWTIIVTDRRGVSCLIAAGEGWRTVAPAPAGPPV